MPTSLRSLAVALSLLVSLFVGAPSASAEDLVVHTLSGDVRGVANESENEWRGIPYAAPPVGELRWRPPAPAGSS